MASSNEDWEPSQHKRKKKEDDFCIIHCSSDTGKLIEVSKAQWDTLLAAAKINHHCAILEKAENLAVG